MTIEQAIESVQNSAGSLFTREDVVTLLNKVGNQPKATEPSALVRKLLEITEAVDNIEADLESASFDIDGDRLSVSEIDIDGKQIAQDLLNELIDDMQNGNM